MALWPRTSIGLALGLAGIVAATSAQPDAPSPIQPPHDNYYAAGASLRIASPILGDVVAAGRTIDIVGPVAGDILVAGWSVTLAARASDDVRVVGGTVVIDAPVEGDVTVAGGDVTLGPSARVAGRTWLSGGTVRVDGLLDRDLQIAGGTVQIAGEIRRPVRIVAERLEVLPTARILGPLDYRSPHQAQIAHGATITGPVTYQAIPQREAERAHAFPAVSSLIFITQVFLAGALLLWLVPRLPASFVTTLRAQPGLSFLVGFVLLVTVPVAALLLIVSLFGLPVGLVVAGLYGIALLVGLITAALLIGEVEMRALEPWWAAAGRGQLRVLLAGVVTLGVIRLVPFVGGLAVPASVLFGLGALGLSVYRRLRPTLDPIAV